MYDKIKIYVRKFGEYFLEFYFFMSIIFKQDKFCILQLVVENLNQFVGEEVEFLLESFIML